MLPNANLSDLLTEEELQSLKDQNSPADDRIPILRILKNNITAFPELTYDEYYPVDQAGKRIQATTDEEIRNTAKTIGSETKTLDAEAIQSLIDHYGDYKNYQSTAPQGSNKILPHQKRTFDSISNVLTLSAKKKLDALPKEALPKAEPVAPAAVKPPSGKLKGFTLTPDLMRAIQDFDTKDLKDPFAFDYLKTNIMHDVLSHDVESTMSRPFDQKESKKPEINAMNQKMSPKKEDSWRILKERFNKILPTHYDYDKDSINSIRKSFMDLDHYKAINTEFDAFKSWLSQEENKNKYPSITPEKIEDLRKVTLDGYIFNVISQDKNESDKENMQLVKAVAVHLFSDHPYEDVIAYLKKGDQKPWNQLNFITERFTQPNPPKNNYGDGIKIVKDLYDSVVNNGAYKKLETPVQKEILDNYFNELRKAMSNINNEHQKSYIVAAINYYRTLENLRENDPHTVTVVNKLTSLITHYQEKNPDGKNKTYTSMVNDLSRLLGNVLTDHQFAKSDNLKKDLEKIRQKAPFYGLFSKHLKSHINDIHASFKQHQGGQHH